MMKAAVQNNITALKYVGLLETQSLTQATSCLVGNNGSRGNVESRRMILDAWDSEVFIAVILQIRFFETLGRYSTLCASSNV